MHTIDWGSLSRSLFSGIEALGILVLLILLVVGWAKGSATKAGGSTPHQ